MPDDVSAKIRSLRSQIAVLESWSRTADRPARTRAARDKFDQRFERQANDEAVERGEIPAGATLPPAVAAERAEFLRRAYFARLALKSAKSRAARKTGGAA